MPVLNAQLDVAGTDMWARIASSYDANTSHICGLLQKRLEGCITLVQKVVLLVLPLVAPGFTLTSEERQEREDELKKRTFSVLKTRLTEVSKHILYRMEKRCPTTTTQPPPPNAFYKQARHSYTGLMNIFAWTIKDCPEDGSRQMTWLLSLQKRDSR